MVEAVAKRCSVFLETRETEFLWNSDTPFESVRLTITYFLNEVKKQYDVSQAYLADVQSKAQLDLNAFYTQPPARAIVYLPHKTKIQTELPPENGNKDAYRADGWGQFDLQQADKIIMIKHKKNQQLERVSYNAKVLEKLNKHFDESFQEYLEANQKFQKLDIAVPEIQINGQQPVADELDRAGQESPKFGQAKDDADYDLKKRQKVGGGDGKSQAQFMKEAQQKQQVQLRGITPEEVATHNTQNDCWTVHQGLVYDVTNYLKYHPGGVAKLMLGAGKDCSALVTKYHAWVNVQYLLKKYQVGFLVIE